MRRAAIAMLACASLCACTSPSDARRALTAAGYTDIATGGYDWFGCGRDDTFATRFTARGPTGLVATGVVCSDWFKGSTIRLD